MFFSCKFKYLLFGFAAFATQIGFGETSYIRIIQEKNDQTKVEVPTVDGQTPSVLVQSNGNGQGFFFATGAPARALSAGLSRSSMDAQYNFVQLHLASLELVYLSNNSVAAAIYPILPLPNLQGTALHVLKNSPNLASERQWFGFLDENNQLLDVALTSQNISKESLQQVLRSMAKPEIDLQIQIPHLTLIQNTDDPTLSRSVSQISALSNKYFYFRNSETSHVGPQSSGSIVYGLASAKPLGIVSCLSKVNSTGPDTDLIRAISLQDLSRYQIIQLTPEMILSFENNCRSYDKKGGGGD